MVTGTFMISYFGGGAGGGGGRFPGAGGFGSLLIIVRLESSLKRDMATITGEPVNRVSALCTDFIGRGELV
jgi:hypothetical protein